MKPAFTGWLTLSITIGIEEVLASTASTACELGATITSGERATSSAAPGANNSGRPSV